MKVMVVDDSLTMRKINSNMVESAIPEAEVIQCADGQEAIDTVSEGVRVIILDINMPNVSGFEALKEIRKTYKSVQIIMCTTEGAKTDVIQALKLGASDYVIKPIDRSAFIEKLQKAIKKIK